MKRLLNFALIIGFLGIDFLFFHDVFKPGELTTLPQYLTGLLSIPVILLSAQALLRSDKRTNFDA